MKKLFLAVAALGMLATSCTKDQTAPVVVEESLVSFEVSAPVISSRAVDAYDVYGIGEAVENLHYAVYLTEGTEDAPVYTLVFTDCLEDAFAGDALVNTSLELKLVNDQTYTAIFWADDENAPYTFDADAMTVTLDPSTLAAQDENLDAFFGHHKFLVSGPKVERVTLERPFSQLNIATADIEAAKAAGVVVDADTKTAVKVTGLYTKLNLLTEAIDETSEVEVTFAAAPKAVGQIDATYEMLSMNYLLVNERKLVDVTFDVETKAGQKVNRLFQNVPVERNYRTNILGNLFVDNIGFEVEILPGFDGVIPTTAEEKLWMAGVVGGEYTLTSDVELSKTLQVTENLILNLNGHNITVNNTSDELGEGDGIIVTNGHLTINGEGTVTANTRAVWARGDGGAKVTINGGKYVGAKMNSEVIYASGNGQITINGGEFEAEGTCDGFAKDADGNYPYAVLNLQDKKECNIVVYGGTFHKFDPANNVSENPKKNFCAEGYISLKSAADVWEVMPYTETINTANGYTAQDALANGLDVTLTGDMTAQAPYLQVSGGTEATFDANGHNVTSGSASDYGFIAKGEGTKLTIIGANTTSNGGGVGATGGAEVVYNSGKLYVDSPSTSGRYLFYAAGEGSVITIEDGNFSWDPADNQKRAYIYADAGATVYVKGGTFGKASTRSGYTAGILGTGNVVITGGTFGFDPSAWVAVGYKAVKNGTTWTVEAQTADEAQTSLEDAIAAGKTNINLAAGEYTFPAADLQNATTPVTIICEEGTVFKGNSKLNINGSTIVGATFSNPGGTAADQTINGIFKQCTFTGTNGTRWAYSGNTTVFEDTVFSGSVYGSHFDGGTNPIVFRNCTFSGFNAWAGSIPMITFENCTFVGNGKSSYNGANLWGSAKMIGCEFTFDGTTATEWIDCIGADKTYEFENCTINGVAYTAENYTSFDQIFSRNNVTVKINGVDCAM